MSTPEGRVKAYLKTAMEKAYPMAYRFSPVQNGMGAPGLDHYYCVNGAFVAFEAKRPGKDPTARQEITIGEIEEAGGLTFVVHDKAEIDAAIEDLRFLCPL